MQHYVSPQMKLLLQIGHFLPATVDWQRATQQSHPDNSIHLHLGAEPRSCIYARFSNLIFFSSLNEIHYSKPIFCISYCINSGRITPLQSRPRSPSFPLFLCTE